MSGGYPPRPTPIRKLEGDPGKRGFRRKEPTPPTEAPTVPRKLDAEARSEWRRIVPQLLALGVLTKIDRSELTMYCATWSQWWTAYLFLQENGTSTLTASGYPVPWPEVRREEGLRMQLRMFCADFGLSPSARTRLATPSAPTERDALDALLGS